MARLVYLLALASFLPALSFGQSDTATKARILFDQRSFEFGDIREGDKVTHTFRFRNTGASPLIISNVLTTCGCTAPSWPKEPIAPGKEGVITAVFNSTGKKGYQNKNITVLSNALTPSVQLRLSGNVLPPKP